VIDVGNNGYVADERGGIVGLQTETVFPPLGREPNLGPCANTCHY
jgi:hypothetical protein